ncbi:PROTEIN putative-RELATED [Salix viminalis]|uniref:PROTEIN putative-RELATED n=1 Tax=Salix viminalis TaxID=40686 RepID=A0A9Q0NIJ3_SALVM|nr:PROTEIN putative-RELATED [Salix viminalis]
MGSTTRLVIVLALLLLQISSSSSSSSSAETPEQSPPSPSPSPEEPVAPANSPLLSPPLPSPSADTGSPSDSPLVSPPAPSPSDSPLVSPPAPPPSELVPSGSAPASPLTEGSELNHSNNNVDAGSGDEGESKGMGGGKKAGIVVGVIVAACMVGLGGMVYKKRQNNIRRSDYGYAARREIL